jgi:hypothetical protein
LDGVVDRRILDMSGEELLELVRSRELADGEALDVLRNPYCTVEIAEFVADSRHLLQSPLVREKLSGFHGLPFGRAMDLLASLPWTALLRVAQTPSAPPVVRRHAEKKLLNLVGRLTLGEKVALARKVHRVLLQRLIVAADAQVLLALLDNPRLAENDILLILNTSEAPPEFFAELARHRKWGQYYGVRLALAECPRTPLPIALSALVQLRTADLDLLVERPQLPEQLRSAARALKEKEKKGLRRVIRSSDHDAEGHPTGPSESLR